MTPGVCTLCGDPAFGVETHPCCEFWRSTIEAGRPCPACQASKQAASDQRHRRHR